VEDLVLADRILQEMVGLAVVLVLPAAQQLPEAMET
jgi:hypothetical protein